MADREEIKEIFDHFDGDDNGTIDCEEFMRLLNALGADSTREECEIGFESIDSDNNGTIDFNEFISWWTSQ